MVSEGFLEEKNENLNLNWQHNCHWFSKVEAAVVLVVLRNEKCLLDFNLDGNCFMLVDILS